MEDENNNLENEYNSFNIGSPKNADVVSTDIFKMIEGIKEHLDYIDEESKKNDKKKQALLFWGERVGTFLGYPRSGQLAIDCGYLGDLETVDSTFLEQLKQSFHMVDDDNFEEVGKLMRFAGHKYSQTISNVSQCRERNFADNFKPEESTVVDFNDFSDTSVFVDEKLGALHQQYEDRLAARRIYEKTGEC